MIYIPTNVALVANFRYIFLIFFNENFSFVCNTVCASVVRIPIFEDVCVRVSNGVCAESAAAQSVNVIVEAEEQHQDGRRNPALCSVHRLSGRAEVSA